MAYLDWHDKFQPCEQEYSAPFFLQLMPVGIANIFPDLSVCRLEAVESNWCGSPAMTRRTVVHGENERHVRSPRLRLVSRVRVATLTRPALPASRRRGLFVRATGGSTAM